MRKSRRWVQGPRRVPYECGRQHTPGPGRIDSREVLTSMHRFTEGHSLGQGQRSGSTEVVALAVDHTNFSQRREVGGGLDTLGNEVGSDLLSEDEQACG